MSTKRFVLLLALFAAILSGQGITGGGAAPGAPGGTAITGKMLNQTTAIASTTFATCPAGTANFCTYLVGLQLECNPANPGTGTGSLSGNLVFSDAVVANYTTQISVLNVATCSSASGSTFGQWVARYIIVRPGAPIQYQVTAAGVTGAYNFDLAWSAQRLS